MDQELRYPLGTMMNFRRPTPTLHDVAAHAGVSTATVSRCLNFPDQVKEKTQRKVAEAISTLGYSPNFGAKAMAARRTNTIGAIIPTMENAIFARGLQAFQDELSLHGFTMLVASTAYKPGVEEEQIKALVARGADALLLIGYDRDPEIYRFLDAQGVPALVVWAHDPAASRPSVGFDNRAAMHEMAKEVIAFGHRNLAYITASTEGNDRARSRLDGIKDAMEGAGIAPESLRIVQTRYGIDEGAAAFETLMTLEPRPTAVLCANDVLAVGALSRARELGINVPRDVSVTGFDDIELAQIAYPALTTVHVPHREMGRRAGKALAELVKDGVPLKPCALAATIVQRDTLGPCPIGANEIATTKP